MTVNSKIVLKGMRKDFPSIKIIEPFQPEVIECENVEDFSEIINADKEKYNDYTTQKLNKTFKIPGYKVTKINGEISLRSIKPCEQLNSNGSNKIKDEINDIKEAFNQLSEQFEAIKEILRNNDLL